jgi:hypothetical protein
MAGENDCRCCDCRPVSNEHEDTHSLFTNLPYMTHIAVEPFLKGTTNDAGVTTLLTQSKMACMNKCASIEACQAGTWIAHGVEKGECWLSANIMNHPGLCEKACVSFERKSFELKPARN